MANPYKKKPATSHASQPLSGRITPPGDKSISHRSLMLGALAVGKTRINRLLESDDVHRTALAMQSLGVNVERQDDGIWNVNGVGVGALCEPEVHLDFGNSGTGARLVMGMVGTHPIAATFTGDASLSKRPMARVLEPLKNMGAEVICRAECRLPLSIKGPDTALAQTYRLPVPSAQVKSAVLLAGLNAPGITTVVEPVKTRDHTERMLMEFGVDLDISDSKDGVRTIAMKGQQELVAQEVEVPGDPSSAAFIIVAALIVPDSDITIENVLYNPSRIGLLTTLQEMSGKLDIQNLRTVNGEQIADVRVQHSELKGINVPPMRAPSMIDEYPILSIAAAFAEGDTCMEGLAELRVKESDRLAAVASGLEANGIPCVEKTDSLTITGGASNIGGGTVITHFDHRIAMSFLVMGLATTKPVTVDDTSAISTSFPDFFQILKNLGASNVNQGE